MIVEVARETVDGLKRNPSCLAAIILAGVFAFLTYLAMQREAERAMVRMTTVTGLLDRCLDGHAEGGNGQ